MSEISCEQGCNCTICSKEQEIAAFRRTRQIAQMHTNYRKDFKKKHSTLERPFLQGNNVQLSKKFLFDLSSTYLQSYQSVETEARLPLIRPNSIQLGSSPSKYHSTYEAAYINFGKSEIQKPMKIAEKEFNSKLHLQRSTLYRQEYIDYSSQAEYKQQPAISQLEHFPQKNMHSELETTQKYSYHTLNNPETVRARAPKNTFSCLKSNSDAYTTTYQQQFKRSKAREGAQKHSLVELGNIYSRKRQSHSLYDI